MNNGHSPCGHDGIGRHARFRFSWETVGVQVPVPAPSSEQTALTTFSAPAFLPAPKTLYRFVAPPPKTGPACAGLRFCSRREAGESVVYTRTIVGANCARDVFGAGLWTGAAFSFRRSSSQKYQKARCKMPVPRHCEAPEGPWQSVILRGEDGFPRQCAHRLGRTAEVLHCAARPTICAGLTPACGRRS